MRRKMTLFGLASLLALLTCTLCACANQNQIANAPTQDNPQATNTTLVVYFSNTGNTRTVAEKIATATDADIFEIEPAVPYTADDLDYNNDNARSMIELSDPTSRPEIANTVANWDGYTTIFIGYPIWWSRTPPIMQTFVETHDWNNKTSIPFCTSSSSPIGSSANILREATTGATWLEGQRFETNASDEDIAAWLDSLQGIS